MIIASTAKVYTGAMRCKCGSKPGDTDVLFDTRTQLQFVRCPSCAAEGPRSDTFIGAVQAWVGQEAQG